MIVTYKTMINAQEALLSLAQTELPIKQSVALARLLKKYNEELGLLDQQRLKLLQEYGQITDTGYTPDNTRLEEFNEKLNELLDIQTDLGMDPVTLTPERVDAKTVLLVEDFIKFE